MIANFAGNFDESGNNRFNYLANLFSQHGMKVTLVTSAFSHGKKRLKEPIDTKSLSYGVVLVNEPGYKKNVSIKRLYSHYILGNNIKKYLKNIDKPDFVYIASPSLSVAKVGVDFANKNNIKCLVDIQDLWPEAFKMVFPNKILGNILFKPMEIKANAIYKKADGIVGVSDTYTNRGMLANNRAIEGLTVFLGTNLKRFDKARAANSPISFSENKIYLAYAGTLGHSYDLVTVIRAIGLLRNKYSLCFIVMGDGPLKEKFIFESEKENIDVIFTGKLPYEEMVSTLSKCDIAINAISKGAAQSIINKHSDYAASGLPVINSQENLEYRNLVEEYKVGINVKNDNIDEFAIAISALVENPNLREEYGRNHRLLAEKFFDRGVTYQKIEEYVSLIYKGSS